MIILCVVPTLKLENSSLYLKLKKLLGGSLLCDLTMRKASIESENIKVRFITIDQYTSHTIGGLLIDIAIIADENITKEWEEYIKIKTAINNGIVLRLF